MIEKFRSFWGLFWNRIKTAYNKAFKEPLENKAKEWRDVESLNLLAVIVNTVCNLCNLEATFQVESDSVQADRLKALAKDIQIERYEITAAMLGDGDFYIFPMTDKKGDLVHSYLTQGQVRILEMDGKNIIDANAIIDWYVDKSNRTYYLLRRHTLDKDGTLTIAYDAVAESGQKTHVAKWEHISGRVLKFSNANHIGFGRYKSPVPSRGLSPVYGVPLNFGCAEIEKKIEQDFKLMDEEFENGRSVVFTDPRNLMEDEEKKRYRLARHIIPLKNRGEGSGAPQIEIFNPNLRQSEHYSKLLADLALYEKAVGTSKGILTENETSATSTATAVKRANSDTIALIGKIRDAIDAGNEMTLEADAMFLNIARDLWTYQSDWYDPFEDPAEQYNRLQTAIADGYAEKRDGARWLFPKLSDEAIDEKLERIAEGQAEDADKAINRVLAGG